MRRLENAARELIHCTGLEEGERGKELLDQRGALLDADLGPVLSEDGTEGSELDDGGGETVAKRRRLR